MYFLTENELSSVHADFEKMKALAESTKKELSAVIQQNELLKSMISSLGLDFKQFSRSKREQNVHQQLLNQLQGIADGKRQRKP